VQALANASGITYAEAHSILAAQGRQANKGHTPRLDETRRSFEGRFVIHELVRDASPYAAQTLAQFARTHWCGSYYVVIRKGDMVRGTLGAHAVAIVNGVIIDNLPETWLRARVRNAWEFERRLSYTGDLP